VTVRDPAILTCREVVELVTEFLSDGLSADDCVRIEQHLFVCPPCTLHVGQVKATIELTGELHRGTAPVALDPALARLFRQWQQK
jgi:hypothetical protein